MTAYSNSPLSRCVADREKLCLMVAFAAFLGALYLVSGHGASVLAIISFSVPCLIEVGVFRRNPVLGKASRATLAFLALIALWAMITLFNYAGFSRLSDGIANVALLAVFMVFIQYLTRHIPLQMIFLMIAAFAAINAFASLIVHFMHPDPGSLGRLVPIGRGGNAIPGAGGLIAGLIALAAAAADKTRWPLWGKLAALIAFALIAFALIRTGSRGPLMALAMALPLGFLLRQTRRPALIVLACLAVWCAITATVLLQEPIRQILCQQSTADFCRSPDRSEVWYKAFALIIQHPFLGVSPAFRFDSEWTSHPHNGLFALAMFYGLPILIAVLFMLIQAARLVARLEPGKLKFYFIASLAFLLGYMGSDMPNLFAYLNMHYLFAWTPLFLLIAISDNGTMADCSHS